MTSSLAPERSKGWRDHVPWVRRFTTARALLWALEVLDEPSLASLPVADLSAAARFHGVAGYLHRRLAGRSDVDRRILLEMDKLRLGGLATHLRALHDLPFLRDALDCAGVPWMVIKGPVVAETLHERPDLRPYSDLDVIVPAACFGEAIEALECSDAKVLAWNWQHRLDGLAGELPLALPSGTVVDLHWHLINHRATRDAFSFSLPAMLARSRPVTLRGFQVLTLDPVDTFLSLACHAVLSGGDRLIWLKDLDLLVARAELDWDTVRDRSAEAGLNLVVCTVLAQLHTVLGTRVDSDVVNTWSRSRLWSAVAATARRMAPAPLASGSGSISRLVSRATRADLPSSIHELARRSGKRGAPKRFDDAFLVPTDSAPARRAYLAAVARQN